MLLPIFASPGFPSSFLLESVCAPLFIFLSPPHLEFRLSSLSVFHNFRLPHSPYRLRFFFCFFLQPTPLRLFPHRAHSSCFYLLVYSLSLSHSCFVLFVPSLLISIVFSVNIHCFPPLVYFSSFFSFSFYDSLLFSPHSVLLLTDPSLFSLSSSFLGIPQSFIVCGIKTPLLFDLLWFCSQNQFLLSFFLFFVTCFFLSFFSLPASRCFYFHTV